MGQTHLDTSIRKVPLRHTGVFKSEGYLQLRHVPLNPVGIYIFKRILFKQVGAYKVGGCLQIWQLSVNQAGVSKSGRCV